MQPRRRVIIESPFAGSTESELERNVIYLERCIRDSVLRGEAPFASHKMYPEALSEATERQMGIDCGYTWWDAAEAVVFYIDLGWSPGMNKAYERVKEQCKTFNIRKLP